MDYPTRARRHADWAITAFLLALLLAWDSTGLDLAFVRLAGSAAGFPLRNHWLTSGVLHEGGRIVAWVTLAVLALNVWRPFLGRLPRLERWQWFAITLVCVAAVPAVKRISATSCPWDLAEFGGTAVYLSHWHLGRPDGGPGHCFPSGHAASAFGFLWGWFALRERHPQRARVWLGAVLTCGFVFGAAQMLRGAHYPSHTLWTAWLCWTICVGWQELRHSRRPTAPVVVLVRLVQPAGKDAA